MREIRVRVEIVRGGNFLYRSVKRCIADFQLRSPVVLAESRSLGMPCRISYSARSASILSRSGGAPVFPTYSSRVTACILGTCRGLNSRPVRIVNFAAGQRIELGKLHAEILKLHLRRPRKDGDVVGVNITRAGNIGSQDGVRAGRRLERMDAYPAGLRPGMRRQQMSGNEPGDRRRCRAAIIPGRSTERKKSRQVALRAGHSDRASAIPFPAG